MAASINPELLSSPDWLLAGFDLGSSELKQSRYHFAQVTRQTYHESSFLDHRIQPMPTARLSLDGEQVDPLLRSSPPAGAGWIFHTGFCCSTLLAGCLDQPGRTLVLREPLVLSRLAHTQRNAVGIDAGYLKAVSRRVTALCERAYPGERVLIKPSNFANRLMDGILAVEAGQSRRKAVLMSSSLESLLVSILKKQAEAHASLPSFVRALLQDSDYAGLVGLEDISQLDLLQQSVVFWHCQRHFLQERLDESAGGVFCKLSMERFLAEPEAVLSQVSRFLELPFSAEDIRQTVQTGAFRRHSKQPGQAYDPEIHQQEYVATRAEYATELAAAKAWAGPLLKRLPVIPFDDYEIAASEI